MNAWKHSSIRDDKLYIWNHIHDDAEGWAWLETAKQAQEATNQDKGCSLDIS